MNSNRIAFNVTELAARVPEGVPIRWQGAELESGPLHLELASDASHGVFDYDEGRAHVEFHVLLSFPELADQLRGLGVDEDLLRPVQAVLRSDGPIRDDHRLALSGRAELEPHDLFPARESAVSVLAGH